MIELSARQRDAINRHTLACWPEEMCGVLTADDFIPMANVAEDKLGGFMFSPVNYARVIDRTKAIVHSHCKQAEDRFIYDLRTPSRADVDGQRRSGLPWLIVGCEGENVSPPIQYPHTPSKNYLGRPFMWFVNDCYTLVQDYYRFERGIILPAHSRHFDWVELDGLNHAFDPYIADYGFADVTGADDLRNGDLLILSTQLQQHNHIGIVHNNQVLHQLMLSKADPLAHYLGRIDRVLRYAN